MSDNQGEVEREMENLESWIVATVIGDREREMEREKQIEMEIERQIEGEIVRMVILELAREFVMEETELSEVVEEVIKEVIPESAVYYTVQGDQEGVHVDNGDEVVYQCPALRLLLWAFYSVYIATFFYFLKYLWLKLWDLWGEPEPEL